MRRTAGAGDQPSLSRAVAAIQMARSTPWLQAEMALRCARLAHRSGNRRMAGDALKDARQACARLADAEGLVERLDRQQSLLRTGDPVLTVLSPAERKVLAQLKTHRTLKEIGEHLYISRTTVKTHVASIYAKLGVSRRADAVAFLVDDDVTDPPA